MRIATPTTNRLPSLGCRDSRVTSQYLDHAGARQPYLTSYMDPKTHWEKVYQTRDVEAVSWFQREARQSLDLITRFAPDRSAPIIDIGAGASVLVDNLLDAGYRDVTLLDLSEAALDVARHRLGEDAGKVRWIPADLLTARFDDESYAVWHDRAVFHFLVSPVERSTYVDQVRRAVRPGGHVIVATFAEDGPTRCSGLPVTRYSADSLHSEFGPDFRLLTSRDEEHRTPSGARQHFVYCLCRRE